MAFSVEFLVGTAIRNSYQWATEPTDGQILEVVNSWDTFRHHSFLMFAIKAIRDRQASSVMSAPLLEVRRMI